MLPKLKTEILKVKGDWREVLNDCRATVGKDERTKDPSVQFRENILIAEHSPIRDIVIKWRWWHIKSWIATHWSRHKWECFIRTQRDDRTGVPRDDLPQGAHVEFVGEANAQHLIDTMRKRLCRQAHPETREYAEDLKTAITKEDNELGNVLVPNCVYRCGCPEMAKCGEWGRFVTWVGTKGDLYTDLYDIKRRYVLYKAYREEQAHARKDD